MQALPELKCWISAFSRHSLQIILDSDDHIVSHWHHSTQWTSQQTNRWWLTRIPSNQWMHFAVSLASACTLCKNQYRFTSAERREINVVFQWNSLRICQSNSYYISMNRPTIFKKFFRNWRWVLLKQMWICFYTNIILFCSVWTQFLHCNHRKLLPSLQRYW